MWLCIVARIFDSGHGVTPESFKQLFLIALTVQATGKPLALDTSGTSLCVNVNTGWFVGYS